MNAKTLKSVLTTTEKMIVKFFPAVFDFLKTRVGPKLEALVTDDEKLEKALKLAFRFMPLPLRFITSKEKFAAFIIARKTQFFGNKSRGASTPAV